MLTAFTALVSCQLLGEIVAQAVGLPLPGPVVGLILLLAALVARNRLGRPAVPVELQRVSQGLLGNLGLLFVPAGVGVITQLDVLGRNWLPVAAALLVSTFAGLVVTGAVMQMLARPET